MQARSTMNSRGLFRKCYYEEKKIILQAPCPLIMADEVSVLFGVVLKKDNFSLFFVNIFARHLAEVNYLFAN
jgi:hypothetical protein